MRAAKIILTSLAAASLVTSAALAQQSMSGIVTKIDRLSGTVTIQQTQTGTVGAAGGSAQDYKVAKGLPLEDLHAGDKVKFSTTGSSGSTTIDKLDRDKP